MKNIKFLLILIVIVTSACEDVFDKKPLNKISESDVWQQEALIQAYVNNLYVRFPLNNPFSHYQWYTWSDEATTAEGNVYSNVSRGGASRSSDEPAYWDYGFIRDLNTFLEKIAGTPIAEDVKIEMEGEVRVIRAVAYWEMQKRYGGVPLVDVVLDPFSEIDEKYTKRATEEAIADFVDSELAKAIPMLTDDASSMGRINKWVAYAYKAKANLWSASIAKFGSVQLQGLVGIPATRANDFYTKASEAAQAVIASGKYTMYHEITDKAENYRNLFLDETNSEVIFAKIYDGANIGHSWDLFNAPPTTAAGRGGIGNPMLEFLLGYENIDGSATQPEFGAAHLYDNGFAPFANKDPRLRACVFFQADAWLGGTIQTYEGIDPGVVPTPSAIISNQSTIYNGMPSVGADSRMAGSDDMSTNTGYIVKKYVRNEKYVGEGLSPTNWIVFRLGEMYLIKAEAEFEKGNPAPAAEALNVTRERAGISLVTAATITRDKIRTERRSEMAFEEGNRYWDLRRWRIAEEVLNSHRFQGLRIIYHYVSGKYYFLPLDAESFSRSFKPEHYYNPITNDRINNNPDLVENPLY